MSKLNKSLIGELQTLSLEKKIQNALEGRDLNWTGYDHTSELNPSQAIVKSGAAASCNRVLLWLASKEHDFVRSPLKGGVLYSLLGELNSSTNLKFWEERIKTRFNEEFSGDLDLLLLKLTPDSTYRHLNIQMIVRDKLTNKTFPVNTEASK